jgi:DNA repair exonuclease SbcCD ATPase subunit
MSIGNSAVTIHLNKANTTLITAPNGTGKSVMLDGLCFCLFGKAYRKITKPQLVNSINQKKCSSTVEFSIGKTEYKVIRGIKPNTFEIYQNGDLINQDPNVKDYQKVLEQQILKMNYRAFTQVVVMGSAAYIPFMKLDSAHRREFIEDLLDIRVFSAMNKMLSSQIKTTKDTLKIVDVELAAKKEVAKLISNQIKEKSSSTEENKTILLDEKSRINADTLRIKDELSKLDADHEKLTTRLHELSELEESLSGLTSKKKAIISKISSVQSDLDDIDNVNECSSCNQKLPKEFKDIARQNLSSSILKLQQQLDDLVYKEDALKVSISGYDNTRSSLTSCNESMRTLNEQFYGNNLLLKKVNSQLEALEDEIQNPPDKSKLKDLAKKIVQLDKQKKELLEQQELQSVAQGFLHDSGIKSKIVKQYVPTINKMVNQHLSKLELFVNFNLDENFNEVIKSRHRDTFTYDSFSQGERQRIDMALIFCWRTIATMKNSINTNLIILDEIVDSSMDGNGMDLTIELLKAMKNNNVFVVSHRENIADKFDQTLKLVKKNNFTTIQ